MDVFLKNGGSVRLPHEADPNPFLSYFVYDGEIESRLPILWMLPPVNSSLLQYQRPISAAAALPLGQTAPDFFDGAQLRDSRNGQKIRFLKGSEFYGDRTINLIPEVPTGGTNAGYSAPYREHLGFWFYRELGVISPWAEFYRVITLPYSSSRSHSQRLVIQQVNEKMLEMNGYDPDGDLYKRVYSDPNWEKHTNMDTGPDSIEQLEREIQNPATRRQVIEQKLDYANFMNYSVASIFTSNWDGYWNNHYMYLPPEEGARWIIIPWDFDWLWGSTTQGMYAEMPVTFPLDGVATGGTQASRDPGPITAPLHRDQEFYQDYLLHLRYEFERNFTEEKLFHRMDETRMLLLEDLDMITRQSGKSMINRNTQIKDSYRQIRQFIQLRRQYLDAVLPTSVQDWLQH